MTTSKKCSSCSVPFLRGDEVVTAEDGERLHVRCWQILQTEHLVRASKDLNRAPGQRVDATLRLLGQLRRIIVVRHGADQVYRQLRKRYRLRFRDTLVIYDRRRAPSGGLPLERRFPQHVGILASRGYLVIRTRGAVPAPSP